MRAGLAIERIDQDRAGRDQRTRTARRHRADCGRARGAAGRAGPLRSRIRRNRPLRLAQARFLTLISVGTLDRLGDRQRSTSSRARRPHLLAIDRQAHRDAGALADAAADVELAAMQRDQPLDDREAEPGAVMGCGHRRCAPGRTDRRRARRSSSRDADAGVLHGERDESAARPRRSPRPCRRGRVNLMALDSRLIRICLRARLSATMSGRSPGRGRSGRCRPRAPSTPAGRSSVPITGAGANGSGVISKLPLSIFDMSRMPLTTDSR